MIENKKSGVELLYQTNIREGMESFDGTPLPTEEVLGIIGQEGVDYIHNTLRVFRETKRKIYGIADIKVYFYEEQYFKILGQPYTIEALSIKDNANGDYRLIVSDYDIAFPYKRKKEIVSMLQLPIR